MPTPEVLLGNLYFRSDDGHGGHLLVVLSRPFEDERTTKALALTAAISSRRGSPREDTSCVFEPAELPGVLTHASYLVYRDARVWPVSLIAQWQSRGELPDALLDRALDGAVETRFLEHQFIHLLRRQDLI